MFTVERIVLFAAVALLGVAVGCLIAEWKKWRKNLPARQLGWPFPVIVGQQDLHGRVVLTSPLLPELLTEGENMEEALGNLPHALLVMLTKYETEGKIVSTPSS